VQIEMIIKLIWRAISSQLCRSCPPAESWSSSKHMPVLQWSYLYIFRFVMPASCVLCSDMCKMYLCKYNLHYASQLIIAGLVN